MSSRFVMFRILMEIWDIFSRNIIEKSFEFFLKTTLWETCLHFAETVIMQIFVPFKMRMSTLSGCKIHWDTLLTNLSIFFMIFNFFLALLLLG